jgi:hypothetical protein
LFAGVGATSNPVTFRFVNVVPEPSALALMVAALGAGVLRGRRQFGRRSVAGPLVLAGLALTASVSDACRADTIFLDDFEDGSATDGTPVNWTPRVYTNGSYDVVGGDFVLTPNTATDPLVAIVSDVSAADVSIRAQIRVAGTSDGVGLFARFQEGSHTYQGGIDTAGDVYIGWNGSDTRYHNLADVVTSLRPNQEDVTLQFDVFGDVLRMYAWRSNEARPLLPTVQTTDNQFSAPGNVGILNDPSSVGSATFRYVHVADAPLPVPEPSGLLAFVGGTLALSVRRRWMPGHRLQSRP